MRMLSGDAPTRLCYLSSEGNTRVTFSPRREGSYCSPTGGVRAGVIMAHHSTRTHNTPHLHTCTILANDEHNKFVIQIHVIANAQVQYTMHESSTNVFIEETVFR